MSKFIQRIPDPEIFFGIVAAIGTNIEDCINILEKKLEAYEYKTETMRVTDSFDKIAKKASIPISLEKAPLEARYQTHIAFGDALRTKFDDDSFLASVAINQIVKKTQRDSHFGIRPARKPRLHRPTIQAKRGNRATEIGVRAAIFSIVHIL